MKILSARAARRPLLDDERWMRLPTNATRSDVASARYLHDCYEGSFRGDFDSAVSDFLQYKIFPGDRMCSLVCTPDRIITLGATIIQRVIFWPIAIETAVRVIEMSRTADQAMFAYATLQGHAEQGIASFTLVKDAESCRLQLEAWSRPGTWLTRLGRPVSRYLQKTISNDAIASFCKTHTASQSVTADDARNERS